jgi:hypothetical protein
MARSVSDKVAEELLGTYPILASVELNPVASQCFEAIVFSAPMPEAFGKLEVIVVVPDLSDLEPQRISAFVLLCPVRRLFGGRFTIPGREGTYSDP